MNIFNLPDLGEGLPDAEIHEWFVKEGDDVQVDQPLVSMETAKAVVEVPCPEAGIIAKLFGKPGDVIKTGDPLIAFAIDRATAPSKGTVVGHLEESTDVSPDHFTIGGTTQSSRSRATPAVRMLAKKQQIDLNKITGTGDHGTITAEDVRQAALKQNQPKAGFEPLRGVRRAMLSAMTLSHQQVVPVSLFDEADIAAWPEKSDITIRLIRALSYACQQEPALNAWYDTDHQARQCVKEVHVGLAMDSEEGLFVPVLKDVAQQDDKHLRTTIDAYKIAVHDRTLAPDALKGATITLSNFGKFAGRFASPIIVPPTVAILAVGRLYSGVVSHEGRIETHRLIPLSLSFDHRAVTGGEATRFLGAVMEALQKPAYP